MAKLEAGVSLNLIQRLLQDMPVIGGFMPVSFFSSLEITRNVIAAMRSLLSQSRENIHPASLKHDHVRIIHDKENRDAFFLKLFSEIPLFYHPFPNVTEYLDCDFF